MALLDLRIAKGAPQGIGQRVNRWEGRFDNRRPGGGFLAGDRVLQAERAGADEDLVADGEGEVVGRDDPGPGKE